MKFLVNGAVVAALLSLVSNFEVEARLKTRKLQAPATDLTIKVYGVDTTIVAAQEEYDQNQNKNNAYVITSGNSAELAGNMWRSFQLPSPIPIDGETVLSFDFALQEGGSDFQAICVDENTVLAGPKNCFIVANEKNEWVSDMYNAPNMVATAGNTASFNIPIGHFFTGTANHIVLIQDNDSDDQSGGRSSFSNIAFTEQVVPYFQINVNGEDVKIPDHQLSLDAGQDHTEAYKMQISADDRTSITLIGNTWKAYQLPEPLLFNQSTTVEFTFGTEQAAEIDSICFENTLKHGDGNRCFKVSGTQSVSDIYTVLQQTKVGEVISYTIPVGHFITGEVDYLGFMQDKDNGDKTAGISTWSNIKIYDDDRHDLVIEVDGNSVSVPNVQVWMDSDTKYNVLDVSEDGLSVTMNGNMRRSVQVEPITITRATSLEFDFHMEDSTDVTFVGFGVEDNKSLSSDKVYRLYGSRSSSLSYVDATGVGETKHYTVPIGMESQMRKDMPYLAFIQLSSNAGAYHRNGQSTVSNITFYERPDIKLMYGDAETSVPNYQLQYGGQDNDENNILDVSDDGLSVTMYGNNWKAVEVSPYTIQEDTVLMFDFELFEETEIHGICLEDDLKHGRRGGETLIRCFKVAGTQGNLNDFFTVPDLLAPSTASPSSTKTYAIRVGHLMPGVEVKYVTYLQDNDADDRKAGKSTISNVRLFDAETCVLDNTSFDLDLTGDGCSFDNFVTKLGVEVANNVDSCSPNVWSELFGFFDDANYRYEIIEKVASICTSGYDMLSPLTFDQLSSDGYQFVEAFFDGDNRWNYEHDKRSDGVHSFTLAEEAGMIGVMNGRKTSEGIKWPDMHNFKECKLHAAMCCWVSERFGLEDGNPDDNSDVCYVDFSRAQRSSHVKDGYSIYGGVEGSVNCHGFAWGDDYGYADNALKGNTLFHVAMHQGLYTNGYVEEVPGAPMCACVEQMPVVTKSACTKINVDDTVIMKYDNNTALFWADVTINSIAYEQCNGNNDLSEYYGTLYEEGKATADEKAEMDKIIVGAGGCSAATGDFLASKGLALA